MEGIHKGRGRRLESYHPNLQRMGVGEIAGKPGWWAIVGLGVLSQ